MNYEIKSNFLLSSRGSHMPCNSSDFRVSTSVVDTEYMREAFQKGVNTNRAYICVPREK